MTSSFIAVMVAVPIILAGRWVLAGLAAANLPVPGEALPVSVRAVRVTSETVREGLRYSGAVKELQKVELSFRVGGTLEHLLQVKDERGRDRPIHEGDKVSQGTVLARLDPSDMIRDKGVAAQRLATADARLIQADADADLARSDFRRTDQLLKKGSATQSEIDSARAKLRNTEAAALAARSEIISAKLSLEQAEANLGYCSINVPFAEATVAERHIDNFERVSAGQPAFLVLDVSSLLVSFRVPDTLVGSFSLGQEVMVTVDALPGERFSSKVHKIGSTADAQTRTYPVEVRIDDPKSLRPGMIAMVHVRQDRHGYLIPLTTVVTSDRDVTRTAVYRLEDESGKTVARKIEVDCGDLIDNRVVVQVGKGQTLKEGDRVVLGGLHRLHDGQAVHLVDEIKD